MKGAEEITLSYWLASGLEKGWSLFAKYLAKLLRAGEPFRVEDQIVGMDHSERRRGLCFTLFTKTVIISKIYFY